MATAQALDVVVQHLHVSGVRSLLVEAHAPVTTAGVKPNDEDQRQVTE